MQKRCQTPFLPTLLASFARQRLASTVESGDETDIWTSVIDLIRDAERQLDTNVNLKLVLENLVVQWAQAEERGQRSEVRHRESARFLIADL